MCTVIRVTGIKRTAKRRYYRQRRRTSSPDRLCYRVFKKAKEKGVHTALDTAGNPFTLEEPFISKFEELMKVTDLVILDFKEIDNEKHKN